MNDVDLNPDHWPRTPAGELDWPALEPEQRARALALAEPPIDGEPVRLPSVAPATDLESRVGRLERYFAELVDRLARQGGTVLDGDMTDLPSWVRDRVVTTNPSLRNAFDAEKARVR